ncbi:hypothetical protein LEMLEM_LOCUS21287 [Lemmus lemmus]
MQSGSRDWGMLAFLWPCSLVPSQAGRKHSLVLAMVVKDLQDLSLESLFSSNP